MLRPVNALLVAVLAIELAIVGFLSYFSTDAVAERARNAPLADSRSRESLPTESSGAKNSPSAPASSRTAPVSAPVPTPAVRPLAVDSPQAILDAYITAGLTCDTAMLKDLMTQDSARFYRPSCADWKTEVTCYIARPIIAHTASKEAVAYFEPFTHDGPSPFFFIRENDRWRIDFGGMAGSIIFSGGTCEGPWNWRSSQALARFCSLFPSRQCPDR